MARWLYQCFPKGNGADENVSDYGAEIIIKDLDAASWVYLQC